MNTMIRTWQLERPGMKPATRTTEQVLHELRAAGATCRAIADVEYALELIHDRGATANVILARHGWYVTQVTP